MRVFLQTGVDSSLERFFALTDAAQTCKMVRSNKCGGECRQGRKWQYESLEVEGLENRVKKNLHLVKRP